MKACVLIRSMPQYRRESFIAGLEASGYSTSERIEPAADNLLVTWNRYGNYDRIARDYERAGGKVLIAENGYLGRDWLGKHWYAVAQNFHNGGGYWPAGDFKRWESFGAESTRWRAGGEDIVILGTRSIGPEGVREPLGWAERTRQQLQARTKRLVRIRRHPGENAPNVSLEDDLKNAWCAVTWGSGAALKAILLGVPVFYGYPKWIGAAAASLLNGQTDLEHRFIYSPLPMLHKLAWAMWTTEEINKGTPFQWLLK